MARADALLDDSGVKDTRVKWRWPLYACSRIAGHGRFRPNASHQ